MLSMSKPKSKSTIYDFFTRKRGTETETPSDEAAENTDSRPILPQTAEISRKDSEGDACSHCSSTSCPTKKKQKSAQILSKSITINHKLHLASYKVSYCVAKEKAPHTIAGRLKVPFFVFFFF